MNAAVDLFPFADYWWFYAGFVAFVLGVLVIDLGVFHKKAHEVSYREALTWTAVWAGLALLFNGALWWYLRGKLPTYEPLLAQPGYTPALAAHLAGQTALDFLTGYIVELSLSVDNLFIFVVVFKFFHVKQTSQHRVLFYGILGAILFRGLFIAAGKALITRYEWSLHVFGAFLIITGIRMAFTGEKQIDPEKNRVIRVLRKILPVTPTLQGEKFFVRWQGRVWATPLLITLIFVEITDVVFAVDSVPAIFGITKEPMIVFTSNIFAILGLRSLYFLLAGAMDQFHLLKYGLAAVLSFVGLKMLHVFGDMPSWVSLLIILGILGVSVVLSLRHPPKPKTPAAQAPAATH